MTAYRKDFDGTKYMMSFLIKDHELLEKYNQIWEKVKKNNLIVNQYTMKNICKLKQNPIMEKSTQISTTIKH